MGAGILLALMVQRRRRFSKPEKRWKRFRNQGPGDDRIDPIHEGKKSRWWQLRYFLFSPKFGEDEPILTNIFQMGWFNHQLEMCLLHLVGA